LNAPQIFIIDQLSVGLRIDVFVSRLTTLSLSRSRATQLVQLGQVLVNGKKPKASYACILNDKIEVTIPQVVAKTLQPHHINLDIHFEDDHVIVVNKPSGLVVHPSAGHEQDTLVNALIAEEKNLSMGFGEKRPGIVHRLDKETSGLILIAKNDLAHQNLAKQFQERQIHRKYQAVVYGSPVPSAGTCVSYLQRHPLERKRICSVRDREQKIIQKQILPNDTAAKWAITNYTVLHSAHELSYVELKLETGRTHQIRVHMSERGHCLIGDKVYGSEKKINSLKNTHLRADIKALSRFYLHACELGFKHPTTNQFLEFKVEWPQTELTFLRKWQLLK
jgi:23S rRNA pseudouridine1911/1915/1917 synthase